MRIIYNAEHREFWLLIDGVVMDIVPLDELNQEAGTRVVCSFLVDHFIDMRRLT